MENYKVPDNPIIPFIEGDGTGPDIWAAASRVLRCCCRKSIWWKKENPVERSLCR